MLTITVVGLFCFLVVLISLVGYGYYARPSRHFRRVAPGTPAGDGSVAPHASGHSPMLHVFEEIGSKMPVPLENLTSARHDLMAAGFRGERAGKVGVKLVFPLVLCLFPAMYIVCIGPVVVHIYRALF